MAQGRANATIDRINVCAGHTLPTTLGVPIAVPEVLAAHVVVRTTAAAWVNGGATTGACTEKMHGRLARRRQSKTAPVLAVNAETVYMDSASPSVLAMALDEHVAARVHEAARLPEVIVVATKIETAHLRLRRSAIVRRVW